MRRPAFIARQSGHPSGWLGAIVGRIMARETANANRVALDLLALDAGDRLLDVGCGHGATLQIAAKVVTGGFLAGVDHSEAMLRIAARGNALLIANGRMALKLADSTHIPYPDGRFNKAVSVHTVYFWAEPAAHFREIFRVLSPGGRLVLGYHPLDDARFVKNVPQSVYAIRSVAEIEATIRTCSFKVLRTETKTGSDGLMAWTLVEKAQRSSGVAGGDDQGLMAADAAGT